MEQIKPKTFQLSKQSCETVVRECFFDKTEDNGFSSVKKGEDMIFGKVN